MKAFLWEKYGPPETLRMAEVEKPAPDADQVLVKVLGTSVNAADWHSLRGKPLFSRATLGLLRPKHKILGVDIAGQVEAVGSGVTQFKPGDEVYAVPPPLTPPRFERGDGWEEEWARLFSESEQTSPTEATNDAHSAE